MAAGSQHSTLSVQHPPRPRLGLVLGAGGVRGCAHAGVIEVLREAGIVPDMVVGASVGALFGLGLAAGLPVERMVGAARDSTPADLFRFYSSRLRTAGSNPIARLAHEAGGGRTFADLLIPFAVTVTDVATGAPAVIDRGPVLPAVEASIALPFVARPVALEGRICVDGGLLDTAPVDAARAMGADVVVAVCLGLNYAPPRWLRNRPWTRTVLERMGRQEVPASARLGDQIRFGCRLLAASYDPPLPATGADLAVWPELGSINPNSIFGAAFCYEQGVRAAHIALPDLKRLLAGEPAF